MELGGIGKRLGLSGMILFVLVFLTRQREGVAGLDLADQLGESV